MLVHPITDQGKYEEEKRGRADRAGFTLLRWRRAKRCLAAAEGRAWGLGLGGAVTRWGGGGLFGGLFGGLMSGVQAGSMRRFAIENQHGEIPSDISGMRMRSDKV